MRSTRADVFCYLIVAILALPTLGRADEQVDKPRKCNSGELGHAQCGKNERCRSNGSDQPWQCECLRDFHLVNGKCVKDSPTAANFDLTTLKPELKPESGGGSSVAAGLLIPTFLVGVAVLLYFSARRYKWLQRFRQYRHNRYGNVLVTRDDDDDDDPPIA